MPLRRSLAAVEPYRPQRPALELQAELGLDAIVKLASNEGAFGPMPAALEAYRAAEERLQRYPDAGAQPLREALAAMHGVAPAQVVIGDGADELIRLCAVATLDPGDRAVTPWPSFPSYLTAAACAGAQAVLVPLAARSFDLDAVLAAATAGDGRRTPLVYLANPNNPTGTLLDPDDVREFLDALPGGALCVLDEAYAEYAQTAPDGIAHVRAGRAGLCVLRTFSKVYGLAGLRIGYAVASPEIADALDRVRPIFNVNQPAQEAALASLGDAPELERRAAHARAGRERLYEQLAAAGLDPEPSQANFVYADVPGGGGDELAERLLRVGVIVRALAGFGAPGAIRVTVGTDDEMVAFDRALAAAAIPDRPLRY